MPAPCRAWSASSEAAITVLPPPRIQEGCSVAAKAALTQSGLRKSEQQLQQPLTPPPRAQTSCLVAVTHVHPSQGLQLLYLYCDSHFHGSSLIKTSYKKDKQTGGISKGGPRSNCWKRQCLVTGVQRRRGDDPEGYSKARQDNEDSTFSFLLSAIPSDCNS